MVRKLWVFIRTGKSSSSSVNAKYPKGLKVNYTELQFKRLITKAHLLINMKGGQRHFQCLRILVMSHLLKDKGRKMCVLHSQSNQKNSTNIQQQINLRGQYFSKKSLIFYLFKFIYLQNKLIPGAP